MQFKITITPFRPTAGDLVLESETPLSGLRFMEEVGKCLRRSIDHIAHERHVTLGAMSFYEITVPQQLAIQSGLFEEKTTIPVIVEHNLLSHYIFYGASVDNRASGRPCYPYMNSEATLNSYVDELLFLADWATLGFPTKLIWNNGLADGTNYHGSDDDSDSDKNHCIGCGGCTCWKDDEKEEDKKPSCPGDVYYPEWHMCPKPHGWNPPRFHSATKHPFIRPCDPCPPKPPRNPIGHITTIC